MTVSELETYLNTFLKINNFLLDPSKNGLQVQNAEPNKKPIQCIAFAVDAVQATIDEAIAQKADVLIVHHGIFWGQEQTITKNHYNRIASLLHADLALYAVHIPLDAHEEVGNNYGLAHKLNMHSLQPFGIWKNMAIGVQGILPKALTTTALINHIFTKNEKPLAILPFGKQQNSRVGIISGGAAHELQQAIDNNLDVFITGEIGHEQYHLARENHINVIAGGHYNTETMGVSLLAQKIQIEHKIKTIFIDFPTNL